MLSLAKQRVMVPIYFEGVLNQYHGYSVKMDYNDRLDRIRMGVETPDGRLLYREYLLDENYKLMRDNMINDVRSDIWAD